MIASAIAKCVLPVPGGAEKADVHVLVGPGELCEVKDQRLLGGGLGGEVEVLEGLVRGEGGVADPVARPAAPAASRKRSPPVIG